MPSVEFGDDDDEWRPDVKTLNILLGIVRQHLSVYIGLVRPLGNL